MAQVNDNDRDYKNFLMVQLFSNTCLHHIGSERPPKKNIGGAFACVSCVEEYRGKYICMKQNSLEGKTIPDTK